MRYKLDQLPGVNDQVRSIAATARHEGKLPVLVEMLKKAVELLATDPHAWGDPVYHTKVTGGTVCHGIVRPLVFHYVIFDDIYTVMILSVHRFTDFE